MKPEKNVLDDALLEHLLGDEKLSAEALQDAEVAARLDELEQLLALAEQAPVPSRPASYGAEVWRRLESQLPAETQRESDGGGKIRRWTPRSLTGRTVMQWAAAVLLILVGFQAGRLQGPVSDPAAAEAPKVEIDGEARERFLLAAVGKHLGNSERLLTEVSNAEAMSDGATALEGLSEQAWAEQLLRSNRLYRRAALRAGKLRIAALLDELEPIFLELAHAPADDELDHLKRRVDEKGLLFKVRVTEGRLTDPPGDRRAASI